MAKVYVLMDECVGDPETLQEKVARSIEELSGKFRVLKFESGKGYRVECLICGNQKWVYRKDLIKKDIVCNHKRANDYSNPKYIGKRVGSLTSIRMEGDKMLFRCDCGVRILRKPGEVFRQGATASCDRYECEYRRKK